MRQRKAKDLEKRLLECSAYLADPGTKAAMGGFFGDEKELYLEIGCGKGNFIIKKARENPDKNFLAVEGQETVILRALEKAAELDLPNLKFMLAFVHRMDEIFQQGQLSGIYLNFSDPWPKARHAKRRLTYRGRLADYAWALKKGGFVEFKTDNDDLYQFTLEEIEAAGCRITERTTDLHSSGFASRHTMTEYEEKFKSAGKNINYVKIVMGENLPD